MTFKKAEMAKTLRNGSSMIETNPLNHNWADFAIYLGLTLHQFKKKLLLSTILIMGFVSNGAITILKIGKILATFTFKTSSYLP